MEKNLTPTGLLNSIRKVLEISSVAFVSNLPILLLISFIFMFPAVRDKIPYFQQAGIKFGPLSNAIDMFSLISIFGGLCIAFCMALVIGSEFLQTKENAHSTRISPLIERVSPSRIRLATRLAIPYAPRIFALLFLFGGFSLVLSITYGVNLVNGAKNLIATGASDNFLQALFNYLVYDLILSMLNPLFLVFSFISLMILRGLVLPAAKFYSKSLFALGHSPDQNQAILSGIEQRKAPYTKILAIPFVVIGVAFVASTPLFGKYFISDSLIGALKQDGGLLFNWVKAAMLLSVFSIAFILTIWLTACENFNRQKSKESSQDPVTGALQPANIFGAQIAKTCQYRSSPVRN